MKINNKPYYLGLDIGTNSVGWAVTDKEYNLCEYKKKALWGIRLFESAKTAEERRIKRSSRRRLMRQHQRIDWIQELFSEEICKIDPTFYIRLNESRLHNEDRSCKFRHPLFNDEEYTDKEFYENYPTIFHLRKALIQNKDVKFDIRMIYLAVHHIVKNRGHFLVDGDLSTAKSLKGIFQTFCDSIKEYANIEFDDFSDEKIDELEKVLSDKVLLKKEKRKKLSAFFVLEQEDKTKEEKKRQNDAIDNICKLLTGETGDIKKIIDSCFDDFSDMDKTAIKFSDSKYEDFRSELMGSHDETAYVIDCIKAVYDWSILSDILSNQEFISCAKTEEYEKHKNNLRLLKGLMRKYCDNKVYNDFFSDKESETNYMAYIGKGKKAATEEIFYKEIGHIIKNIESKNTLTIDEIEVISRIKSEIETYSLLPLQRSKNNSVIPKQVHETELKAILSNAEKHYPFLSEKDGNLTVSDKIISIFNYRIPYYVGPLGGNHIKGKNSWMIRKEEGKIFPWNFNEKVDLEESNEAFIRRMTNKCTYIAGEDVIPKNSLLYSKYMVLNELNNLRIRGEKVNVKLKQRIFNDLFLERSRVTGKALLEYLIVNVDSELKIEDLSGFDKDFKSNMNSYIDFNKKIFKGQMNEDRNKQIAEDIIKCITIYDNDSKMIRRSISKKYKDEMSEEQIIAASRLKYSGWGNFSEKFLRGITGAVDDTGEFFTIINALWETNNNLMQLLSGRYSFSDTIKEINFNSFSGETKISYEKLVEELYVSPANKRAIWQTIQIAEEIKKVMGREPEKIFIEMARSDEEKGDRGRKESRKDRLLKLYENCEDDVISLMHRIKDTDERKFNKKKLYLYYTQKGKCMYTKDDIDLDELMMNNSQWDIDHIYPQSKIVDDSLDNMVLVKKTNNLKKSDGRISPEIQKKMSSFWKGLLNNGLISKKKYDRLNRKGDFTDEELAGFINRQIVETRQSSKAVAEVFERIYKDKSKVVYVKANLVSRFRNRELKELKSRRINDYHHAKDAYLNIVVGNVYNAKFTSNPILWMKNRNSETDKYSLNKVFYYDVIRGNEIAWRAPDFEDSNNVKTVKLNERGGITGGSIDIVRAVMKQNNILYTEYCYCEKGKLFDENIVAVSKNPGISIKKGLDTSKYGGYKSPNTAYFALVEFDDKKGKGKRQRQIVGVPVFISNLMKDNPEVLIEYFQEEKGLKNVRILRSRIKKNSLIAVNGFPMRIRGENEKQTLFKQNLQLKMDIKNEEIVRRIEKYLEKRKGKPVSEEFDGFNDEELIGLYDALTDKLNTVYRNRPANKGSDLIDYRDKFIEVESGVKASVINEILTMLRCDIATTANLKDIGGKSGVGNIAVSKNTLGKSKLVLINQSVTGIFEQRTVL